MQFEILTQRLLYQGFFRLEAWTFRHELFQGGWSGEVRREVLERGNAVAVLIHDPIADTVLLVEQFRPGSALRDADEAWMLEIVAGIIEPNEDARAVARREAQEEAACTLTALQHILDFYPSAGGSTEIISLFYAPVDLAPVQQGIHGLADEQEDIRVLIVPRHQAMAWLREGKVKASVAVVALQWLTLEKLEGRL